MPLILGTNSIKDTSYDVANSCRFEDGDSATMSKSNSGSGNRRTWTFSCWVKLGNMGIGDRNLLSIGDDISNTMFVLDFLSSDILRVEDSQSGSNNIGLRTTQVFRDPSSWYHICVAVDTTQGTAANRVKLYVNGVQVTAFGTETYPDEDYETLVNHTTGDVTIGSRAASPSGTYFDGYMAEVVMVDGSALAPTSFGEFDSDSPTIWKPIDVSGLTFGTNGFYLDFEDSANLGNDANGGTDFTESNLAATDQTTDTPTNSFATLNPLVNFNSGVFSEGSCAITFGDDTISTIGVTKGRWYWEAQRTNTSTEAHFGIGVSTGFYDATSIVSDGDRLYTRSGATYFSTASNLGILSFGSNGGTSAAVGNGDVIGFYLDLESDTKNITIKKNDGGTPIVDVDLTYSGEEPIFAFCRMNSGCASSWNFGNPIAALTSANSDPNGYGSFEFSTTLSSVDYYALCSKNLAEFG